MSSSSLIPAGSSSSGASVINLNNPSSFNLKTVTPSQARERLNLLNIQQDALERDGQDLSPRSTRELAGLAEVFSTDEVRFSVRITRRDPAQFYTIEFNLNPVTASITTFTNASERLNSLNRALTLASSPKLILSSLVNPSGEMQWYQAATLAQMDAIMRTDFLDGLKHTFIANLNLLAAAKNLCANPAVYNLVLSLHGLAFELYEDQVSFNRSCELNVLDHAETTKQCAIKMRDQILTCGSALQTVPPEFLENTNNIVRREAEKALSLYYTIDESFESFLKKIESINLGILNCIEEITSQSEQVRALMLKCNECMRQKEELSLKEQAIFNKYTEYQNTKAKEHNARKTEMHEGGLMMLSWKYTRVVEANFGSAGLLEEYDTLKEEAERINTELNKVQQELSTALRANTAGFSSTDELQSGASALSAALVSVKALESAIKIKHAKAQTQIQLMRMKLGLTPPTHSIPSGSNDPAPLAITGVPDAVQQLDVFCDKILSGHALWLQTYKQCGTIQRIREDESHFRTLLIEDIQHGTTTGLDQIRSEIQLLESRNEGEGDPITSRMLSNEQLLIQQQQLD